MDLRKLHNFPGVSRSFQESPGVSRSGRGSFRARFSFLFVCSCPSEILKILSKSDFMNETGVQRHPVAEDTPAATEVDFRAGQITNK